MISLPPPSRRRAVSLAVLAVVALATLAAAPAARAYEGYGYQTIGGQGGSTCHVTTLAASGSGSLADCVMNRTGARIVVFDVAGTITLGSTININRSFLTIDGSTAPSPGITIRPANTSRNAIVLENVHDVIIHDLRMQGYDTEINGADLIGFDGDAGEIYNVVVDHLTFTGADDGAVDITNSVRDVTVSWCFFHDNTLTSLVKYGTRRRISYHHNVFARNGERNPQLQGDLADFDYVNNVVYEWGRGQWGYGLRIRNVTSEGRVSANVVNNLFVAGDTRNPENGLIFGTNAGPDGEDEGPSGTPAQGTVVTTSDMGSLWVSGNVLTPENRDQYSTVSGAIPVPPGAQVTTWPASGLRTTVLPSVGMSWRTSAEQALIDEIAGGAPAPSVGIDIGDAVVDEGDSGTTVVSFPVSLSEASGLTVTVAWSTADGTAMAGSDYAAGSGTLTFPPGTTTRSVNVSVIGDTVQEEDETFFVNLTGPVNATLATAQGQATIVDDDTAPPSSGAPPYDFGGNGSPDILWRHETSGQLYVWLMDGVTQIEAVYLDAPTLSDMDWEVRGVADFNADGHVDILWHNRKTGDFSVWFMDGTTRIGEAALDPPGVAVTTWHIRGVADLNGDGKPDILWRDEWGSIYVWFMDGTSLVSGAYLNPGYANPAWRIRGTGDFNLDGKADILWQHDYGDLYVWFMDGTSLVSGAYLNPWVVADADWEVARVADIDFDGYADILWRHQGTGALYLWYMVGTDRTSVMNTTPSQLPDTQWQVVPRSTAPWGASAAQHTRSSPADGVQNPASVPRGHAAPEAPRRLRVSGAVALDGTQER